MRSLVWSYRNNAGSPSSEIMSSCRIGIGASWTSNRRDISFSRMLVNDLASLPVSHNLTSKTIRDFFPCSTYCVSQRRRTRLRYNKVTRPYCTNPASYIIDDDSDALSVHTAQQLSMLFPPCMGPNLQALKSVRGSKSPNAAVGIGNLSV